MTSTKRPPGLRLGEIPEIDAETGDYIFRFPIEVPAEVQTEDKIRWVIEEQLRALLDLVELGDRGRPARITQYRFLNESGLRDLYPAER